MSDHDFTRQFAIRLPSGELLSTPEHEGWYASLMGMRAGPPKVVIYDTRAEAEEALQSLQKKAASMGMHILASIESRLCSPFSDSDPSEQFAAEVEKWAAEQGGAS